MPTPDEIKQLAPTGQLRGGVVTAPAASTFFVAKDGSGVVRGVTVDLLRAFAETFDLPFALQVFENSGQVTDAVMGGTCDIAFMPHDAARAEKVDFGPAYFIIESTYLVPAGSRIQTIDEVNRNGVRIVAIANTTTGRSAHRTAPLANFEEVAGVDLMVERARKGEGPSLIENKTYRIKGHFVGDPELYREKKEVEGWQKADKDPILRLEKKLIDTKALTKDQVKKIRESVQKEIEEAVKFAQESPEPDVSELLEGVYA